MASSSVVGEPFGAMPVLQNRNRFVPLPAQVDHINSYTACVNAAEDAHYFARGQADARGGDPVSIQYASWFLAFAHGAPGGAGAEEGGDQINMVYQGGKVVEKQISNAPFAPGSCALLLNKDTKKYMWPRARENLRITCARFHSGLPFEPLPSPVVSQAQCVSEYGGSGSGDRTLVPWKCQQY